MMILVKIIPLIPKLGIKWILFRIYWPLKKRFTEILFLKKYPDWQTVKIQTSRIKNFHLVGIPSDFCELENCKAEKDPEFIKLIKTGYFKIFDWIHIPTSPNKWNIHPIEKTAIPTNLPSFSLGTFDYGDIRVLWEIGRMGVLCQIIRNHNHFKPESLVKNVISLQENFKQTNQPFRGPFWMCGQETAIRGMHWICTLAFFKKDPTYSKFREEAIEFLWFSAKRVKTTLGYALSQRNNHGISEACFLMVVGIIFPGWPESKTWKKTGIKYFKTQIKDQIYSDGGYCQRSHVYQYLTLSVCLFSLSICKDFWNEILDETIKKRLISSCKALGSQINLENGNRKVKLPSGYQSNFIMKIFSILAGLVPY